MVRNETFSPRSGIKQGYHLSLLFNTVLEFLASTIKQEKIYNI